MNLKIALTTVAAAIVMAAAPTASAAPASGSITVPVSFAGNAVPTASFNLTGFANQNGQLVALGTITATGTQVVNGVSQVVTQVVKVALPVSAAGSTCEILYLDVQPITLNLLGLNVTTSEIKVNITAQSGAGNLLGNLLCDVAHLLDNPNAIGGLVAQLNNILSQL